jgi:hypothetical protein
VVTIRTTCFKIMKLCILPTDCICVVRMILTKTAIISPNSINRLGIVMETCVSCEVLLNSCILFRRNVNFYVYFMNTLRNFDVV